MLWKKTDLKNFRIYGSAAHVQILKLSQDRGNSDEESKLEYFVGYGLNCNRIWHPEEIKTKMARHAVFIKTVLYRGESETRSIVIVDLGNTKNGICDSSIKSRDLLIYRGL